ncbi:MAG: phospholipase D family protein, partial [Gallionella sp.]|nr:phospholipase D family protein [Gallionella sp.]
MKVAFLTQASIASTLKKLMAGYDEFYWAVAWGTENKHSDLLAENKKKIKQLIFGTHFYQTDPKLLEQFVGEKSVRVMPNDAPGTFHPKVYLFIKGNQAAAIVGSANFTNGAMSKNEEAAVMLTADSSDSVIQGIKDMVGEAWQDGKAIDQDFLDAYRLHYRATAHYRRELGKQRKLVKPGKSARNKGLQLWSWDEYARKVQNDPHHAYDGRIALLKEARELFVRNDYFADMTRSEEH